MEGPRLWQPYSEPRSLLVGRWELTSWSGRLPWRAREPACGAELDTVRGGAALPSQALDSSS